MGDVQFLDTACVRGKGLLEFESGGDRAGLGKRSGNIKIWLVKSNPLGCRYCS